MFPTLTLTQFSFKAGQGWEEDLTYKPVLVAPTSCLVWGWRVKFPLGLSHFYFLFVGFYHNHH